MPRPEFQRTASKVDLLDEIGGEAQFDFVIMTFCELIQEDSSLGPLFKGIHVDTLVDLMKNLLDATLDIVSSHSAQNESTRNRIVMKNYAIFELGLNKSHFAKMKVHYESALHDAWVEDEVFSECMHRFEYLESILEEEGKDFEVAVVEAKKVAARILNARCA